MARRRKRDKNLEAALVELLSPLYPGIEVTVEHSNRWDRMCATFRWSGFAGLLPEERFERLLRILPEEFRAERMQGLIWLELEPDQEIDDFLGYPRSEDIADREADIYHGLESAGAFDALQEALGPNPTKACQGQLDELAVVLKKLGFTDEKVCDAKLLFIRHGAFCDCQALLTVRAELAKLHPEDSA